MHNLIDRVVPRGVYWLLENNRLTLIDGVTSAQVSIPFKPMIFENDVTIEISIKHGLRLLYTNVRENGNDKRAKQIAKDMYAN